MRIGRRLEAGRQSESYTCISNQLKYQILEKHRKTVNKYYVQLVLYINVSNLCPVYKLSIPTATGDVIMYILLTYLLPLEI